MLALQSVVAKNESLLVTPHWLNDHLRDRDVVVLQVNYLKLDYDKEHIEGARFLWPAWLAPDSPHGSFNVPDAKEATEVLQRLGINNNSKVVLCFTRNELSVAARMFLTLEHFGLKDKVYWLDGGLEAWKKAGFATTYEEPDSKRGNFRATPGTLLVNRSDVQKAFRDSTQVIVDARAARFYNGESSGLPRDGHIPGAKNIPYTELIDQNSNHFKPIDQLNAYFVPVASTDKELITYCFIGQTASVVYLAGRVLGYNMKLYDGSMQEWSRIDYLPVQPAMTKQTP